VVRIGPAGWAYKDWNGIVYPSDKPKGFDPVGYLAQYFDTIEINSSFYGPPRPSAAKAWAERVQSNERFRFTAKPCIPNNLGIVPLEHNVQTSCKHHSRNR
jgi:uncharacterized protein YecE (DUF72 family)